MYENNWANRWLQAFDDCHGVSVISKVFKDFYFLMKHNKFEFEQKQKSASIHQ